MKPVVDDMLLVKKITVTIIILLIGPVVISINEAHAVHISDPSIQFDFGSYTLGDGQVGVAPVIITVSDSTASTDTISVTITSDSDPTGITLVLSEEDHDLTGIPDPNSGVFRNKNLIFIPGNYLFPLSGSVTINVANTNANVDSTKQDELPVFLYSKSGFDIGDPGISIMLKEIGDDTGFFTGTITFTSGVSSGNVLHASEGDVITIFDGVSGAFTNGLIIPNPDPGVGAIRTGFGETITASYGLLSTTTAIDDDGFGNGPPPGGSGGGLLRPGFVLDLAGGLSGGDFTPPTLTLSKLNLTNLPLVGDILDFILNADPFTPIMPLDDPSIDYPISINGNGYLLTQFANTIQTYTGKTGEPVSFKMTLFDATGVEHIALFTNLRGDAREVQNSDTHITYNEDKPLEITDPHGYFSNVNFTESEYKGKYLAEFNMTFAKPMDTSDVIIRTWDEHLNSGDTKIFDAIKIEGEPIVNPDTNNLIVPESSSITIPYYKLPYYEIPNADSEGNLIYYNSFGGLEEKQVQPYHAPTDYPDHIGKAERHDDGFYESIINEEVKAQKTVQRILVNPFTTTVNKEKEDIKFNYSGNVGKLDRQNKEILQNMKLKEFEKATKIFNHHYKINHISD